MNPVTIIKEVGMDLVIVKRNIAIDEHKLVMMLTIVNCEGDHAQAILAYYGDRDPIFYQLLESSTYFHPK